MFGFLALMGKFLLVHMGVGTKVRVAMGGFDYSKIVNLCEYKYILIYSYLDNIHLVVLNKFIC